jgi:hypothetical protein
MGKGARPRQERHVTERNCPKYLLADTAQERTAGDGVPGAALMEKCAIDSTLCVVCIR